MNAATVIRNVRGGEHSAVEYIQSVLAGIAAHNGELNAFSEITAARALREAAAVDAARSRGDTLPPLAGLPFAVKNLFDIEGVVTLAGSRILASNPPASRDATLVARLSQAGAILVGALHMGEFAYDFTGENVHYGATRNPIDPSRIAGGSSSGSGAAVGASLVPLALSSDTNGSIRVPSALCGVFGLKPTFGRLGRGGSFPFVMSLDHLGPMTRTVLDLILAYNALQGPDARDPACDGRIDPVSDEISSIADLRGAVLGGYFEQGGTPEAFAAVQHVAQALKVSARTELPHAALGRSAAYLMTSAEGGQLHLQRLKKHWDEFEPAVRDRLTAGALSPAAWLQAAQRFRRYFRDQALSLFERYDFLLAPATPIAAPLVGTQTIEIDGISQPLRPNLGLYTQPISFLGWPALTVPVWTPGQLPLGVQIIAAPWREYIVLRLARSLEHAGAVQAASRV